MTTKTERCGRLRWVVPDATSVERPRLQQEFQVTEHSEGLIAREWREWRDVPIVVVNAAERNKGERAA